MSVVISQKNDAGILKLTLNRPEKLNALNGEVLELLEKTFLSIKDDASIRGLVLTGTGKDFCAGADIQRLADCDALTGYEFAIQGQRVFRLLETLGKPSIAAINGFAFGGGCELAMSATLRMAAASAKFSQPEVKLGVIPGYGGTQRLARLVGKGRALDLCLTGRVIDAETALHWGLVSQVVAAEELEQKAEECLKTILDMAPLALKGVMAVIDEGYDLPLNEALHMEALHFAKVCASQDKKEGVAAFLNKRPAQFKGE